MKYWLVWGVVLLICLIVQSTLLPMLTYNGTHADLLLVVIVLASLHLGPKQGTMIYSWITAGFSIRIVYRYECFFKSRDCVLSRHD